MTDRKTMGMVLTLAWMLVWSTSAQGQEVQDLVRLKGAESNRLIGTGLVVGLKGTGDGGKFMPAMRPLAAAAQQLGDTNVNAAELKDVKNVAWVSIEATLPAAGVREGDRVDVVISSLGASKSLQGGQLFPAALSVPIPHGAVYALASGSLTIEDTSMPTRAVIRGGAQLLKDVRAQCIQDHKLTLVLNEAVASWPMANMIAQVVNGALAPDEAAGLAKAVDPKNVEVRVPVEYDADPALFISLVMRTFVDASLIRTGARVVINEHTGTIVMTGDVRISPVLISHKGLTITTITPPPQPTVLEPRTDEQPFAALDPENRGGARLADLLAAFNQLKVEAADRIAILKLLEKSGKLHAQLVME